MVLEDCSIPLGLRLISVSQFMECHNIIEVWGLETSVFSSTDLSPGIKTQQREVRLVDKLSLSKRWLSLIMDTWRISPHGAEGEMFKGLEIAMTIRDQFWATVLCVQIQEMTGYTSCLKQTKSEGNGLFQSVVVKIWIRGQLWTGWTKLSSDKETCLLELL